MSAKRLAKDLEPGDVVSFGGHYGPGDDIVKSVIKSPEGVIVYTERGGEFSVSENTTFDFVGTERRRRMSDMTIEEFCDLHDACAEGREWALANCTSMQDAWNNLKPEWLIWVATRPGILTDKELRLFAVHCARSVEHLMTDQRSNNAIAVAERHANGEASDAELAAARAAAMDAAWAAARSAARAAAWDAARDAAWAAAMAAAMDVVWAAASDAAMDVFCQHLRSNTVPNFAKGGDDGE